MYTKNYLRRASKASLIASINKHAVVANGYELGNLKKNEIIRRAFTPVKSVAINRYESNGELVTSYSIKTMYSMNDSILTCPNVETSDFLKAEKFERVSKYLDILRIDLLIELINDLDVKGVETYKVFYGLDKEVCYKLTYRDSEQQLFEISGKSRKFTEVRKDTLKLCKTGLDISQAYEIALNK